MRRGRLALALALGGYGLAEYLGATWGSTPEERARRLPSDDLVSEPTIVTNHGISIGAPPAEVWPWLLQMGWHRAGWYTYQWVDQLLFPVNNPSADEIVPELQTLAVGDQIPDGPPETGVHFLVEELEDAERLVLRSRTHLPPWPPDGWIDWVWTYTFEEAEPGVTRLHLRTRGAMGPPLLALGYRSLLWMDFVMARSHLRGIRERVERAGTAS